MGSGAGLEAGAPCLRGSVSPFELRLVASHGHCPLSPRASLCQPTPMSQDLTEIEVGEIPALEPGQAALLDNHSLLNVLNVLRGELTLLGLVLEDDPDRLAEGLAICDEYVAALHDSRSALACAEATNAYAERVIRELDAFLRRHPEKQGDREAAESTANVRTVLEVLRVRAGEVLARERYPGRWESFPIEKLRRSFFEVFAAIEAHSRGRFRIIYNFALQQPQDYYVDLKFEVDDGNQIWMPPVFVDVMRDLIANARKYTPPGGCIIASLHEDVSSLRFAVQDNGRGIPEADLKRVVAFGVRGTNVGDVRTMGGGFGLTKAFLVTKRFGGRFWIASREGTGTRIRIAVPRP